MNGGDEREWLARQFEELLAPALIDADLADRAKAYFEAHVLEHAPRLVVEAGFRTDVETTLLIRNALRDAIERAIHATAEALRDGKI